MDSNSTGSIDRAAKDGRQFAQIKMYSIYLSVVKECMPRNPSNNENWIKQKVKKILDPTELRSASSGGLPTLAVAI